MPPDLERQIHAIATDHESGASELLVRVHEVLETVLRRQDDLEAVGRALLVAQPSMASLWTAVGQALAGRSNPAGFDLYLKRMARAPDVAVREATALLNTGSSADARLRIVTLSCSGTVARTLEALASSRAVEVCCAEGQPALEGRRLAARLAAAGVPVTYFTDASIGHGLDDADAVVVGADAVTPAWFLNKSGTRMLAAAAAHAGIPLYVLATRDKFVSAAVGARLVVREESPDEVWSSPPAGVRVRNPYFERTPLDLTAALVSDMGVLSPSMVGDACTGPHDELLLNLVDAL